MSALDNKLLYPYQRPANIAHKKPSNTILADYTYSLIFDLDRQSIFTYQLEFGYMTHINPGVSILSNTTSDGNKIIRNIGTTADGTLTYTYSSMSVYDNGYNNFAYKNTHNFVSGASWEGTRLKLTYGTFTYQDSQLIDQNKIITNIHLDHSGKLTYSSHEIYNPEVTATYLNNGGKKILASETQSKLNVITGIKQDKNGQVSYEYSTVSIPFTAFVNNTSNKAVEETINKINIIKESHVIHEDTGTYSLVNTYTTFNIQDVNESWTENIVDNIYISSDGDLRVSKHNCVTPSSTVSTAGIDNITSDVNTKLAGSNNKYKVVTNISQSAGGQVSFTYTNLYTSHSTLDPIYSQGTIDTSQSAFSLKGPDTKLNVITDVNLSDSGVLQAKHITLNTSHKTTALDIDETSFINNHTVSVLTYVNLSNDGELTYRVTRMNTSHINTAIPIVDDYSITYTNKLKVVTDVNLTDNGIFTYKFTNLNTTHITNPSNFYGNVNISNNSFATNGRSVVTGIMLNNDGELTYSVSNLQTNLKVTEQSGNHTRNNAIQAISLTDYSIGNTQYAVVTGLKITDNGSQTLFTYDYSKIKHGSPNLTNQTTYTTANLTAINSVTVDNMGHLITYGNTNNIDKVDGYHISISNNVAQCTNNDTIYFYIGS